MSEQTPPPGAPQAPQSQPEQPQQSFGPAPGGAESFGSAPPPPPPGPPPAEEPAPKKKSPLPRILLTVAIAAVVILGSWFFFGRSTPVQADVGQCLAGTTPEELDADKLKVVDCAAPEANFKVVERVDGKNRADSQSACTNEATQWTFWSGTDAERAGTTLCLAPAK